MRATNNAKTGTSENIVCAIDGSISATVNSDNETPSVGPKTVPAIAYLIPPSRFCKEVSREAV